MRRELRARLSAELEAAVAPHMAACESTIELAQEGDLGAIRALAEEYRAEAAQRGWDEPVRWRGLAEVRAEALGRRFTLVARAPREAGGAGRAAAGVLIARPAAEGGVIRLLTVDGEHRRRGLGSSLLVAALARLGPGPVYLEVARDNAAARALYTRAGFVLYREGEASDVLVRPGVA